MALKKIVFPFFSISEQLIVANWIQVEKSIHFLYKKTLEF